MKQEAVKCYKIKPFNSTTAHTFGFSPRNEKYLMTTATMFEVVVYFIFCSSNTALENNP